MKYDGLMDKECIALCDAINEIPFLMTTESCCGHSKDTLNIWLKTKNIQGLYILARAIDRRYGGPVNDKKEWRLLVEDNDRMMDVIFRLESSCIGEEAYKQANIIAENIKVTLKHKNCMKAWLSGWEEKLE